MVKLLLGAFAIFVWEMIKLAIVVVIVVAALAFASSLGWF